MNKKLLLTVIVCLFTIDSFSQQPVIFQRDGKALDGYDAVSFFAATGPVKGYDSLSVSWENTEWLFSSLENKAAFAANPGMYAPQYGGYCAYGMSRNYKAPVSIDTWTVEDGKLYFNYNKKVKNIWNKDRGGYIEKANANWPDVKFN